MTAHDHPTEDPVSNANNRTAARNGEDCAYPCEGPNVTSYGLTKRERFAMAAMQGFMANTGSYGEGNGPFDISARSVEIADALLKELAK